MAGFIRKGIRPVRNNLDTGKLYLKVKKKIKVGNKSMVLFINAVCIYLGNVCVVLVRDGVKVGVQFH